MPSVEIAALVTSPAAFVTVSVYVKAVAGIFGSLAVLVTVRVICGKTVRFVWAGNVGALLTSLTTTLKVLVIKYCFVLKAGPLVSDTTAVNVFVLGPCVSFGVQVMTPAAEMAALVT